MNRFPEYWWMAPAYQFLAVGSSGSAVALIDNMWVIADPEWGERITADALLDEVRRLGT